MNERRAAEMEQTISEYVGSIRPRHDYALDTDDVGRSRQQWRCRDAARPHDTHCSAGAVQEGDPGATGNGAMDSAGRVRADRLGDYGPSGSRYRARGTSVGRVTMRDVLFFVTAITLAVSFGAGLTLRVLQMAV